MNYLNKIVHGSLLEDNFSSLSLAWEISPNTPGLVIEHENYIELAHGDEITYLLIDSPQGDYTFEVDFNHEPIIMSDIAGVVIMSNKDNYIELQSYDDNSQIHYDKIKFKKQNSRFLFYARRKADARWQYIGGSTLIDVAKIGFFIKGLEVEENNNLLIEKVNIYRDTLVGIDNIPEDYIIEIFDETNELKIATRQTSDERVFVDTKTLNTPLKNYRFVLKDKTRVEVFSEVLPTIYGGDVFIRNTDFTFFINGGEVISDTELDFGNIDSNVQYISFDIRNNLDISERNKSVFISPVSNYYKGDEIIYISKLDEYGEPIEFKKKITIDEFAPSELIKLQIKMDRSNYTSDIFYQNDFKAKIVIE